MKIAIIIDQQNLTKPEKRLISKIDASKNFNIILVKLFDLSLPPSYIEHKRSIWKLFLNRYFNIIEKFEKKVFLRRYLSRKDSDFESFCGEFNFESNLIHIDDLKKFEALRDCDLAISANILPREKVEEISKFLPLWMPTLKSCAADSASLLGLKEIIQKEGISEIGISEYFKGSVYRVGTAFVQTQPTFTKQKFFLVEKFITNVIRELNCRFLESNPQTGRINDDSMTSDTVTYSDGLRYSFLLFSYVLSRVVLLVKRRLRMDASHWRIYFGRGRFEPTELARSKELASPKDEFWADPFLHSRVESGEEVTYLFFENYEYSTGRGKISVGRLVADSIVDVRDAVVRPYHLSFPFVFEHQGVEYMMPEAGESGRIEIWEADNFPDRWRLSKTVFDDQSCADSVIFKHEGNWWLFTNIASDDFLDHCTELHIFKIDSPLMNEVVPHSKNPVMLDARYARNAGRIKLRDGRLVRIAQNNRSHYGFGFSFIQINKLTLDDYDESLILSVTPDQLNGALATHHFDDLDDCFVYDCRR